MTRPILAVAALVVFSGCVELGPYATGGPYSTRYPDDRRAPTYDGRSDDYRRTAEYRRVSRDAADYARFIERNLRTGQERQMRQVTERRAEDLLRRTRARDHARVYPFPRRQGHQNSFWNAVDRDIEGQLSRQKRDEYRYLVRHGEARYRDRYHRSDRRDDRGWGRDDGHRGRVGHPHGGPPGQRRR